MVQLHVEVRCLNPTSECYGHKYVPLITPLYSCIGTVQISYQNSDGMESRFIGKSLLHTLIYLLHLLIILQVFAA